MLRAVEGVCDVETKEARRWCIRSSAAPQQVETRKEIVEPAPGSFMHHLEVQRTSDLDRQVRGWLTEAN